MKRTTGVLQFQVPLVLQYISPDFYYLLVLQYNVPVVCASTEGPGSPGISAHHTVYSVERVQLDHLSSIILYRSTRDWNTGI